MATPPLTSVIFAVVSVLGATTATAAAATVFTLRNNCPYTVWPAAWSGNGGAVLGGGGFELPPGATAALPAPTGWSGRFWARTSCAFAPSGTGSCATGDCGGALRCTAAGKAPVTLAEFGLGGEQDFYDVSLVDGYNVGMGVRPTASDCGYAGCVADLNGRCPAELRVAGAAGETAVACRSACEAFGKPEYCCTGDHSTPQTCGPTDYSRLFKAACPAAYSYAYDDATSTFACAVGTGYDITFCPSAAADGLVKLHPYVAGRTCGFTRIIL